MRAIFLSSLCPRLDIWTIDRCLTLHSMIRWSKLDALRFCWASHLPFRSQNGIQGPTDLKDTSSTETMTICMILIRSHSQQHWRATSLFSGFPTATLLLCESSVPKKMCQIARDMATSPSDAGSEILSRTIALMQFIVQS